MEEFKYTVTDKPWDISWHYSYTDEFGSMGVLGEAVQYAPERIPALVGAFRKAWTTCRLSSNVSNSPKKRQSGSSQESVAVKQ